MDLGAIYNLLKVFHLIFMTTWMAGLFYLPRIFVYHSDVKKGTQQYKTFNIMEKKLYKYIMNPSLIGTWIFGILLIKITNSHLETWLNIKLILLFFMTGFHIYCGKVVQAFEKEQNKKKKWVL